MFKWEVTSHNSSHLVIHLDFGNPDVVSQSNYGRDALSIRLLDPSFFISTETGIELDLDDLGGTPYLNLEMPPLDLDPLIA